MRWFITSSSRRLSFGELLTSMDWTSVVCIRKPSVRSFNSQFWTLLTQKRVLQVKHSERNLTLRAAHCKTWKQCIWNFRTQCARLQSYTATLFTLTHTSQEPTSKSFCIQAQNILPHIGTKRAFWYQNLSASTVTRIFQLSWSWTRTTNRPSIQSWLWVYRNFRLNTQVNMIWRMRSIVVAIRAMWTITQHRQNKTNLDWI